MANCGRSRWLRGDAVGDGMLPRASFNILGSFFPAWLLCGIMGIVLAVVARLIFVRTNFEKELSPLDPGVSVFGFVLYVYDLAAVLQLNWGEDADVA